MAQPLDIVVVGFGAIGTIYGWLLEKSGKARVTAVCRSNYEVMKDRGVDIHSDRFGKHLNWKPYRVVRTVDEAADRDYFACVCTFKTLEDVHPTPKLIGKLLEHTETFVLIQNGIGIHKDLQKAVPNATVITACAWIDTTVVDDYKVVKHGPLERLVLGVHSSPQTGDTSEATGASSQAALDTFVDLLQLGGGTPEPVPNIDAARWRKNLWNAAFSTVCTLSRGTVRDVCSSQASPHTLPVLRGCMEEVVAVGRAIGLSDSELPSSAIDETLDMTFKIYDDAGAGGPYKPSMLVDLEANRPMEVEAIVGNVVRQAREVGVETPRLDTVYTTLKVLQTNLLRSR